MKLNPVHVCRSTHLDATEWAKWLLWLVAAVLLLKLLSRVASSLGTCPFIDESLDTVLGMATTTTGLGLLRVVTGEGLLRVRV